MSELTIDSLVSIKKNHVKYSGNKYFRRNAHVVELGGYGRKKTEALSVNYLSVSGRIAKRHFEKIPLKSAGPIEVNWHDVSRSDLGQTANLKFFGFDTEQASAFDLIDAEAQRLKLMCFWVNENPLNNDANAVRENMAEEGKDARVVSSILVAMDTRLAEFFSSQSTVSLDGSDPDTALGITAGTGYVGSKTIRLVGDTTIAYALQRPKWRNRKSEIDQLEDDWFSFG